MATASLSTDKDASNTPTVKGESPRDNAVKQNNCAPEPLHQEPNNDATTDDYYAGVSRRYRTAKHISLLTLVVFLLFSFTFLRGDITLENLRYLLKFISFTNTETSISAAKINYSSGDPSRFELLGGDLCTLTPNGYVLYDKRGNQIMAEELSYNSPILKACDKFSMCYDLGGNSFKVFNTFTKLYEETTEYPITDGAVSDTGSFAIASSTRDYHTAITVYDQNFKQSFMVLRKNRLMALEIKKDASELAVMTAGVKNGRYNTVIELIEPGKTKAAYTAEADALGYALYYTDSGFCAVTDEDIRFYDKKLGLTASIPHPSSLSMTECTGDYFVALYRSGLIDNSCTAVVYDLTGKVLFEGSLSGKPVAIHSSAEDGCVFILTGTEVTRINLINKKIAGLTVSEGGIDILAESKSSILVAFENYALMYDLEKIDEKYFNGTEAPKASAETTVDKQ